VKAFTLIVPFYRNGAMLREQVRLWEAYPENVQIIVVDDGSPEPAKPIIDQASGWLKSRLSLYRIEVDIPWNRGGARNLGAKEAQTDWIVHVDIDHVLTGECARRLLAFEPNPKHWYRFERYRNGRADETRQKDAIPPEMTYGKIKPHIDSYLCTREMYWKAGGYDEDYSGILGGGSPFLKQLEKQGAPLMAPSDVHLVVYTRSVVSDASDNTLSRDRTAYAEIKRRKERAGKTKPSNPIRFPWTKQSLHTPT
jgi:glycosyltransferase involved in cell wall biosynthesis